MQGGGESNVNILVLIVDQGSPAPKSSNLPTVYLGKVPKTFLQNEGPLGGTPQNCYLLEKYKTHKGAGEVGAYPLNL